MPLNQQAYLEFLHGKILDAGRSDGDVFDESLIHPSTKPHQRDIILWALRQRKALIGASFGLGKTTCSIELARLLVAAQPGKKFLVVAPLGVRHQFTLKDGPRLGIDWQYVYDDKSLTAATSPFVITNYERIREGNINIKKHDLAGASLDEGNVMRSLGSKTVDVFRKAFRNVPYVFVATATPAPNNYREIIYYADFLGVADQGQLLTRFFKRNPEKAGDLTLHPQHEDAFWLWVSTWALFMYKPSDMGYSDKGYELPPLNVHWHRLPVDHTRAFEQTDTRGQHKLLVDPTNSISELSKEKRETLPARIEMLRKLLIAEPERHWIIWHNLEDERRAIDAAVPGVQSIYGTLDLDEREKRIIDFSEGRSKLLSSKPVLTGSGCNLQEFCSGNIFLGVDYKFNEFIQAIHRTQRFQQKHPVDVHIIYPESEEPVVDTLKRKWEQHNKLVERMRAILRTHGIAHGRIGEALRRTIGVQRAVTTGKRFTIAHNDCVLEADGMADDSVDLLFTSIPFSNHYEYTTKVEDFGHNSDDDRFFQQMDFLLPSLYRILKPGRVAAIHVKDRVLYGHQTASGILQIDPFSNRTVIAFTKHGFLFEGQRTIVTDVVRENNSTYRLGWTEMTNDASKMGSGLPEYLLLFRKAPTSNANARADEPVTKKKKVYSRGRWQLDAHGLWRSNGNVLLPASDADKVQFLLGMLCAKAPYDFEAHVARLEEKDRLGHLPASFLSDPPLTENSWVWDDIAFMQGLNGSQAVRKQRNHICPLPFDIVRRVINLYSNKGDVVYDPFSGLGTVAYCAVEMKRYGIGTELSPDYYGDSTRYLKEAEAKVDAPTLFDLLAEMGTDNETILESETNE